MDGRIGGVLGMVAMPEGAAEGRPSIAAPLTRPGEFTGGIEGPSCDAASHIGAVNFARR